jgi:hypothetical protein
MGSGEKDLPHANGIKPHPNGRFLRARGMISQGYGQKMRKIRGVKVGGSSVQL